jgi:anti-anti-sigma factor
MRVVGSLDGANVDELEQQFVRAIDSRPKLVVVDLAGVDVISSIAMGALLRAHQSLRREGGKLLLASVTPPVLSALRRARIDLVVGVRASVDAALAGAAAG